MNAQYGRKLFWGPGTHAHYRSRLTPQEVEFNDEFVSGLLCAAILRKAHHLSIDRIRSLRGEIITEDFQNTRDAFLVVQMAPSRRLPKLTWG